VVGGFPQPSLSRFTIIGLRAIRSQTEVVNRLTPGGIEAKISRWLAAPFLSGLVHYQLVEEPGG
jgi:hypothetical protein